LAKPSSNGKENQGGLKPTVSVLPDFILSFMKFSKETQKRIAEWFEKFAENPTQSSINYESLEGVRDDKVRSVRIDKVYRGIVITPEEGNVYLLAMVDREDDAYRWVKNRKFSRQADSGEVTITHYLEEEERSALASATSTREGLLAAVDDEDLISFGIPAILLPSVRAITEPDGFHLLSKHISTESINALKWLGHGLSIDDVRKEYESYAPPLEPEKLPSEPSATYNVPIWSLAPGLLGLPPFFLPLAREFSALLARHRPKGSLSFLAAYASEESKSDRKP
jgi:hypothetical protein